MLGVGGSPVTSHDELPACNVPYLKCLYYRSVLKSLSRLSRLSISPSPFTKTPADS